MPLLEANTWKFGTQHAVFLCQSSFTHTGMLQGVLHIPLRHRTVVNKIAIQMAGHSSMIFKKITKIKKVKSHVSTSGYAMNASCSLA